MIVDRFQMDAHYDSWRKRWDWDIKASYSDMKMEFSVGDEDIQDTVRYNFEMFEEMMKPIPRSRSQYDKKRNWYEG